MKVCDEKKKKISIKNCLVKEEFSKATKKNRDSVSGSLVTVFANFTALLSVNDSL